MAKLFVISTSLFQFPDTPLQGALLSNPNRHLYPHPQVPSKFCYLKGLSSILHCRYDQQGKVVVTLTDDGLIFLHDCQPSSHLSVVGYIGNYYTRL